jgi:hypothetical protein
MYKGSDHPPSTITSRVRNVLHSRPIRKAGFQGAGKKEPCNSPEPGCTCFDKGEPGMRCYDEYA